MKKTKPNIIDVIIVTVLLLVVAASILRTQHFNNTFDDSNSGYVIYTVNIYGADTEYCKTLYEGDKLYLGGQKMYCGEITDVICKYSDEKVIYPDGTAEIHLNPSLTDITLKVKVAADLSDGGFYIGDRTYISLGQFYDMYSLNFTFNGQVISAVLQ